MAEAEAGITSDGLARAAKMLFIIEVSCIAGVSQMLLPKYSANAYICSLREPIASGDYKLVAWLYAVKEWMASKAMVGCALISKWQMALYDAKPAQ